MRVERQQADREVAVRLRDEQVAADRGQVADRRRGDRLDRAVQELDLAPDLRERRRRADA